VTDRRTRLLRLAAGQLAVLVGMLHFFLGIRNWSVYLGAGLLVPPDARGPLWVLSGLLVLVAVPIVVLEGITDRRVYAAGITISLVYFLGYYAWHLGGHRTLLITGDATPHAGVGVVEFLVSHTLAGPAEFFALLTEAALIVVLVALWRRPEPDA
jgi:hypothetical protein